MPRQDIMQVDYSRTGSFATPPPRRAKKYPARESACGVRPPAANGVAFAVDMGGVKTSDLIKLLFRYFCRAWPS